MYFIWVSIRRSTFRVVLAVKPRRAPYNNTAFAAETFLFPYELSLIFTSVPDAPTVPATFHNFLENDYNTFPRLRRRRVYAIRIVFFPNENSPTARNPGAVPGRPARRTWPAFDQPVSWVKVGYQRGPLSEATISEI